MKMKQRHFLQPVSLGRMLYSTSVVVGLATLLTMTEQAESQAPKSANPPRGGVEKGRTLYIKYGCYECHGTEAQGGGYTGPRLAPPADPLAGLLSQVRDPVNEMPPFTNKVLSDDDLLDIYAFLRSIPNPPDADTIPILGALK